MKIIVCLDDLQGMAFGGKRQSRDRVVTADIATTTKGKKLYADEYSLPLLREGGAECESADSCNCFGKEDYLFLEIRSPAEYVKSAEEIVVYRWNRRYPADIFFGIELLAEGFKLCEVEDIVGYSHEKISKEIYVK